MPNPPGELVAWVDAVNREDYYAAAKEALYEAWFEHRSPFYHGLQMLAAGLLHAAQGNPRGARIKLDKARQRLQDYAPAYLGLDVASLLAFLDRCREIAAEGEENEVDGPLQIPAPALSLSCNRARGCGDEPEDP